MSGGRSLANEDEDEPVFRTISYCWRSATLLAAFDQVVTIHVQHKGTRCRIPGAQAAIDATKVTDAELGLHRNRHPLPHCQSTIQKCNPFDVLFLASRMPDTGNTNYFHQIYKTSCQGHEGQGTAPHSWSRCHCDGKVPHCLDSHVKGTSDNRDWRFIVA